MTEPKQPWARPSAGRPPVPGTSGTSPSAPQPPASPRIQGVSPVPVAPSPPEAPISSTDRAGGRPQTLKHLGRYDSSRGRQVLAVGAAIIIVTGLVWGAATFSGGDSEVRQNDSKLIAQNQITTTTNVTLRTTAPQEQAENGEGVEWELMIRSVAAIVAECSDDTYGGSAVVVIDGSYLLTNYHVIEGDQCEYFACFTDTFEEEPSCNFSAVYVDGDPVNDLAVLRLVNADGSIAESGREPVQISDEMPGLGSELTHIGYPGLAGLTLTLTVGRLSGVTEECGFDELGAEYLKTDATGGPGMSGGGVFDERGKYVGTHTAGCSSAEERGDYSLVKPARFALDLLRRIR